MGAEELQPPPDRSGALHWRVWGGAGGRRPDQCRTAATAGTTAARARPQTRPADLQLLLSRSADPGRQRLSRYAELRTYGSVTTSGKRQEQKYIESVCHSKMSKMF